MLTRYLARMIDDLEEMRVTGEDTEECTETPTEFAYNTVRALLIGVMNSSLINFPRGHVYPDCDGGIRIEWRRGDNHLRVQCYSQPSEKLKSYLYVEEDTGVHGKPCYYGIDLSLENFLEKLRWFDTTYGYDEGVCKFCGAIRGMEGSEKLNVCFRNHPWSPATRFTGVTTVRNLKRVLDTLDPDAPLIVMDCKEVVAAPVTHCYCAGEDDQDGYGDPITPGSLVICVNGNQ